MTKKPVTAETCCSVVCEPVADDVAERLAEGFKALSDPVRLKIFNLIASQGDETCACALVEPTGKSQPTVSHHLKALFEAGLVGREKRGSWVWYWAIPERVAELRAALSPDHVTAVA